MAPILLSYDELMQLSQQALETYWARYALHLPEPQQSRHIKTVHTILYYNFTTERWKRVIDRDPIQYPDRETAIQAYAYRVAAGYEEQHLRVHLLERGESQAWKELRAWLLQAAHITLRRKYDLHQTALSYEADECVQRSCEIIYTTRFPYDVAFDAWARRILENAIRKRYRQTDIRRCDFFDDLIMSSFLNDAENLPMQECEIRDPRCSLEGWELVNLVIDLISHLPSRSQQEVMQLTCFYDLDDAEIAKRMGKSVQAVHNLRNRARGNLLRFLDAHPGLLD